MPCRKRKPPEYPIPMKITVADAEAALMKDPNTCPFCGAPRGWLSIESEDGDFARGLEMRMRCAGFHEAIHRRQRDLRERRNCGFHWQ